MGFKPIPRSKKHLSAISNRETKLHRGTRSYVQLGLIFALAWSMVDFDNLHILSFTSILNNNIEVSMRLSSTT